LTDYFGGGVGVSWQDYTVETLASESDSSLAWQILIGFEKMNPSPSLFVAFPSPFLQYRFLRITEGDFGAFKTGATLHLIEFGFRFYGGFGS
jgi:opacity protein-like surface antigen